MSDKVIKCESVYKIFGTNAAKMLKEANAADDFIKFLLVLLFMINILFY